MIVSTTNWLPHQIPSTKNRWWSNPHSTHSSNMPRKFIPRHDRRLAKQKVHLKEKAPRNGCLRSFILAPWVVASGCVVMSWMRRAGCLYGRWGRDPGKDIKGIWVIFFWDLWSKMKRLYLIRHFHTFSKFCCETFQARFRVLAHCRDCVSWQVVFFAEHSDW